jgi:hypothetical protein
MSADVLAAGELGVEARHGARDKRQNLNYFYVALELV